MNSHHIYDKLTFDFDSFADDRGTLTITSALEKSQLPFTVQRVFWITNVPAGKCRGMHAHKTCWEALVAVNGQFTVKLDDGKGFTQIVTLSNPQQGLLIPPMMWCKLYDFSADAVCLCMASGSYDKEGYILDFESFKKQV